MLTNLKSFAVDMNRIAVLRPVVREINELVLSKYE
jgi:hypothetical protein